MSYERELLVETVLGLLGRYTPEEATELREPFDAALWADLADHGFTLVGVPEEAGGLGGDLADAVAVARAAGRAAAAVPLADSVLAGTWVLAGAGLMVDEPGPIAVAADASDLVAEPAGTGWRVRGMHGAVPWAPAAETIAVLAQGPDGLVVAALPRSAVTVEPGWNLAGEPSGSLRVDAEAPARPAPSWLTPGAVRVRAALARAATMSGALDRVLELTAEYVRQRRQFGRPLARFQAVQQELAELAGEVAAAAAALQVAVDREAAAPAVAAAKVRSGLAAGRAARLAHQLHGAIGFTDEHQLHRFTRRLWAWRDEYGTEAEWSIALGRELLEQGADGLWPALTA